MPSLIAMVGDLGDPELKRKIAARLAPSSTNGKPIAYRFRTDRLTAFIVKKNHGAEEIDLGISMAHFDLGAMHDGKSGGWIKEENGYSLQ